MYKAKKKIKAKRIIVVRKGKVDVKVQPAGTKRKLPSIRWSKKFAGLKIGNTLTFSSVHQQRAALRYAKAHDINLVTLKSGGVITGTIKPKKRVKKNVSDIAVNSTN